ncbi:succinyl-CoA synthetase-like protein [Biscogniauxia marginata]|nr:succinyl-CoA synthetase-like protein [Biscogniauxia marginata]
MLPRVVREGVREKVPSPYDSTLKNLKIGSHTRATANAKDSIEWGTNIVGGVTPGREGEHLGLPVLPTVRKAMDALKPDATGIYVAAHQATGAIEEAIEAQVPLIVAVAEHIPLHDMLRIHSMLRTQSVSRLVGANSPGIISSAGKCRIGFQPLPCFEPGKIGIVARSGTLSYETAASTLRAGLGQSMCIGVGGDILPGTTLKDGLRILAEDSDTEGIALIGEIGGHAEIEAADWIKEYRASTSNPKPIVALVAGINAVPERIMGHAGAFSLPGEPSALAKVHALKTAGAAIINHPSRFGPVLKTMLRGSTSSGTGVTTSSDPSSRQPSRRGIHTAARQPGITPHTITTVWCQGPPVTQQARSIYLTRNTALDFLRRRGIPVTKNSIFDFDRNWELESDLAPQTSGHHHLLLGVTVNRSTNSPCVIAAPALSSSDEQPPLAKFDFDYAAAAAAAETHLDDPLRERIVPAVATHLGLPASAEPPLARATAALVGLFREKEAFLVETRIIVAYRATDRHSFGKEDEDEDADGEYALRVVGARLGFDDAAFRSCGRHGDVHGGGSGGGGGGGGGERERDRDTNGNKNEDDGIVYVRLDGGGGNIGTLVNGAGLAMNTVDALADAGGAAANFLDTGGKATSETVKRSFEIVLRDPRVKCVFVNIFGGLTLGDMIARGVVLAFRDLRMTVPVVVRIRGTNEKEGQRIIAESGLPLFAFDDFDEAAAKVIELARGG